MVKGSKYLPIATPWQQLSANNQYMCTEHNVVPYVTTTCTEQLMQFQNNLLHCTRYTVHIEKIKVQRLSVGHWIIYSQNYEVMTYKCVRATQVNA
ncbi:unnamed protein product [Euphydryas editha]|uniref:Uncharacterized protein n=1 Tax=Euphydryas editha TaxID=104508 RepID=A0AAU9U594_EUPED|nr:unnamed protein product [Euphydryas editha]